MFFFLDCSDQTLWFNMILICHYAIRLWKSGVKTKPRVSTVLPRRTDPGGAVSGRKSWASTVERFSMSFHLVSAASWSDGGCWTQRCTASSWLWGRCHLLIGLYQRWVRREGDEGDSFSLAQSEGPFRTSVSKSGPQSYCHSDCNPPDLRGLDGDFNYLLSTCIQIFHLEMFLPLNYIFVVSLLIFTAVLLIGFRSQLQNDPFGGFKSPLQLQQQQSNTLGFAIKSEETSSPQQSLKHLHIPVETIKTSMFTQQEATADFKDAASFSFI